MSLSRRILLVILIVLSALSVEARAKKKKQPPAEPAEQVLTSASGEAENDPDKPKPATAHPKPSRKIPGIEANDDGDVTAAPGSGSFGPPVELKLTRAHSAKIDLRKLPFVPGQIFERPELPEPTPAPRTIVVGQSAMPPETLSTFSTPRKTVPNAPAPPTSVQFDGISFNAALGVGTSGHPPDTNGDVGPTYYIQTVNTAIGIYDKTGNQVALVGFNTFMSQGAFGNLCDTNNFGDPVVLYDTFEDRWVITDFAFTLSGGNVVSPAYQCVAVSINGDPVNGGWHFYSINSTTALGDYPKFGVWNDGIYMSANQFTFGAGSSFISPRVWAFNKAQMYAGAPSVQVVTFAAPNADFTLLPSNARLQSGTPPAGSPNYFVATWEFLNALTVYKFHVDWNSISLSTFTGPDTPLAATSWPNAAVANAPSSGGNSLDVLQIRAMMQNQYTNYGGTESLWTTHTVRRANTSGFAAPRWYQVNVTGGTVNPNLPQATTWDPDGANVLHRFVPSLALDRAGDLALGYSVSSSTTKPAIMYAGRLAADPVNTFSQGEQLLIQGTGTQTGTCGSSTCIRWGDYSAMTLDPDGCRFWFTTEYYAVDGLNDLTRIGAFAYPSCTPVGAGGTISGTVTATAGGAPIPNAAVTLGSRTTTADGSGFYSFSIPAGTYATMTAVSPGFITGTASNLAVTDGNTTTQNFSLANAPTSACPTDTTQADFARGVTTNTDLTASPGDVVIFKPSVDQQNTSIGTSGVGITVTTWGGQTFTPSVNGLLTAADLNLFCSGCTGTTPNLTLSLRATSGGLPTGADLATGTITGFGNGGVASYFHVTFSPQVALTAGTMYAMVIRPTANPSPGTYALTRSGTSTAGNNVYPGGTRVSGATSGTVWSIPLTGGVSTDAGFVTYMDSGYGPSGNFVSGPFDANPSPGITPIWSTFSWTASTPANTSLQFQIAGSNSAAGPFNFVGPDGTAATFFTTSPVQLSPQFYNLRYLEYKAYLATTDGTVTPALNDATFCFNDVDCSGTQATITTPSGVCTNSTGNTATGPAGMTAYGWGITNGTITSATNIQSITYTAGASGTLTLTLNVVAPNGCLASGSTPVTINPLPPTPTITPGGPTTFTYPSTVTLTSSSATGNQWYVDTGSGPNAIGGATNQSYIAGTAGSYTVAVTDGNGCVSAASAPTTVTVNKATPVVTATGGTFAYNGSPQPGSGSATGGAGESLTFTLTYTGTGSTTYGPSTTAPTFVGTYQVVAHTDGDANNTAGDSAPAAITITQGTPTVTATGGTFTYNGNPHAGSGSATGAGGETLTIASLTYNGTGSTTYGPTATAPSLAGTYTITAHTNGDANNIAADSAATPLTINKFNPLMAAHGGTFTYNGNPEIGTGQAIGGAGETLAISSITYLGISGTTWGPTTTPPTNVGIYLVTAHTLGDANNNAGDSLPNALRINKASATIVVTGYCVAFDGAAHTAIGTATGVLGESLASGLTLSATTHTAAGTYAGDAWTFIGGMNYTNQNGTVNDSIVNAVISAPLSAGSGATGNIASVANAGAGATYAWSITNGTITGGAGTTSITFTAGSVGTLTLQVTVTTTTSCADTKSANVTVLPPVAVTSVSPTGGTYLGGTAVTINGTGFVLGATVTFGGTPATNIVFFGDTKLTAKAPAHVAGAVNVVVTNPNTAIGTLTNGYTYSHTFDPNGDNTVDPSDIFYLIKYLFDHGPAPAGAAGMLSGDANNDGVVDPADIFYLINYLFLGGPAPASQPGHVSTSAVAEPFGGTLSFGAPVVRNGRTYIPVILTMADGAAAPQALALKIDFDRAVRGLSLHRAGAAKDTVSVFEINRPSASSVYYLVSFNTQSGGGLVLGSEPQTIAEVELGGTAGLEATFDPAVTTLGDAAGTRAASVSRGNLTLNGISTGDVSHPSPKGRRNE